MPSSHHGYNENIVCSVNDPCTSLPGLCYFFLPRVVRGGVHGSAIPLLSILKIFQKLLQQELELSFEHDCKDLSVPTAQADNSCFLITISTCLN